ncbi:hypothetical protein [Actinokineospora alba]|uniref:hypothetical protein n=1 Tax=Actinokineospora alba TaxID=504798 RepID=UPI001414F7F6|nr:hypothetical protein [Actinokineospora alba]
MSDCEAHDHSRFNDSADKPHLRPADHDHDAHHDHDADAHHDHEYDHERDHGVPEPE